MPVNSLISERLNIFITRFQETLLISGNPVSQGIHERSPSLEGALSDPRALRFTRGHEPMLQRPLRPVSRLL